MDDDDLFLRPNVRNTDPRTSHAAARPERFWATDAAKVWVVHREAYPRPLADYQMEDELGGARNGKWRKRRSDWTEANVLVDSGRELFCIATRKPQIMWTINPALIVNGIPIHSPPKSVPRPSPYDNLDD
jgi:hypothetical protein